MIESGWLYLAVMLSAAGVFPFLQRRLRWRVFEILPPIVLTYLFVVALAVVGLWQPSPEIVAAQGALVKQLLPALLFLLMATCDLRAIFALGPRLLAVFACAMLSILIALIVVYLVFRHALPADGALIFAALSATWVGGSANLLAVKQAIGLSESSLAPALLTDAVCYSVWVVVLFSTGPLVAGFNRWAKVENTQLPAVEGATVETPTSESTDPGTVLVWLGLAMLVGLGAQRLSALMPSSSFMTPTTWTVLIATVVGLIVARSPLGRVPGAAGIASALLAVLVAVMASQSSFAGLATAPLIILCGFLVLAIHAGLLMLAARALHFDLRLCAIASLAQIGGIATAPILAATYSPALVPVAVLMAMLGYILGTGVGLMMAQILSALAPVAG